MTAPAVTSTLVLYQTLQQRILSYVPVGPALPTTALSTILAGRCYIGRPSDPGPMPYVTILLQERMRDGSTHGVYENFTLEVQAYNRPPTLAGITTLQRIADQIEAALTDFKEATTPVTIRTVRMRRTIQMTRQPADRDVITEYMLFDGYTLVPWIEQELGTS